MRVRRFIEVGSAGCRTLKVAAFALLSLAISGCAINGLPQGEVTGSLPSPGSGAATVQAGPTDGLTPPAAARKPGQPAKVVMLLPLTGRGQLAVVAKAMKQAGELALFEQPDSRIELVVKDDQGTPEAAKAAAEEAIKEGAELILGPLLSTSVQAVAGPARSAGVPVIAFSNDRQAATPGVYLLSFLPDQEVERIVTFAAGHGRRNLAALVPDDAYGRISEAAFQRAVAQVKANSVSIEHYAASGAGMLEATRRLAEQMAQAEAGGAAVDAVLVPGGPETLASLGPLIAYAKLDTTRVKLLGSGGWDAPQLGRDQTFIGGWFPAPDPRGWQAFSEKFGKTFGNNPPRIASLAFDAVGVAVNLAQGEAGRRYTAANLTRSAGFTGADGSFRFDTDGTAHRALAVLEVQSIGANVLDPAPSLQPDASAVAGAAGAAHAAPQFVGHAEADPPKAPKLN